MDLILACPRTPGKLSLPLIKYDYSNIALTIMKKIIKEIKLKTEDISCTGCIGDMETFLRDQKGILDATVNFADAIIDIKYDPEVIQRAHVIHAARKVADISKVISEQ
jgi:copper chaperone CopZ